MQFYNEFAVFKKAHRESVMGNSLHNKIQLGRVSPLASRKVQAMLALGFGLGIALTWLALATLH
jgi:hypothetical protein